MGRKRRRNRQTSPRRSDTGNAGAQRRKACEKTVKVTAELVSCLKLLAVFIAAFLLVTQPVAAVDDSSYPTRPIHLIVGFAAGSSGDVAARIVSNKLAELLKQTVIVENRPG